MGGEVDLRRQVLEAASGHILARAIHTAVELGLADRLDQPKTSRALAQECQADPTALDRLLRFLTRSGYFVEDAEHRYSPTPSGAMLRSDAPGNAAMVIRSLGSTEVWQSFERLTEAVTSGLPSQRRRGGRVYTHDVSPEEEAAFAEAMAGYHWGEAEAVAEAYDFSQARHVVDIGGSTGRLLTAILTRHTHLKGTVLDRPANGRAAQANFAASGLSERASFKGGDFFKAVPADADVYILSHVLHDWGDKDAREILAACRKAAGRHARLLVVEALAASPEEMDYPMPADMLLLANSEGRWRTLGELDALLKSAGFRFNRLIGTSAAVSLVEASPS